jgi:hypothetical protein
MPYRDSDLEELAKRIEFDAEKVVQCALEHCRSAAEALAVAGSMLSPAGA